MERVLEDGTLHMEIIVNPKVQNHNFFSMG